jgi:hypothetical protein
MIQISYTALADFMTSSQAIQRKTLIDYKYPDEDEPRAKRLYYREARDAIRAYHVGKKPTEWLEEEAARLAERAALAQSKPSSVRLRSNSRALTAYVRHYDSDQIQLSEPFKGQLIFGNVTIRVNADLHGIERNREKIVRIDYSKTTPDSKYCSIVAQLMYEAACASELSLPPSAFVIRHIETKIDYASARKGARLLKDIVATCENIEGIWTTL